MEYLSGDLRKMRGIWRTTMRRKVFLLALLAICVAGNVKEVWACACCADKGAYGISVRKPDNYLLSEFKNLKFASDGILFTSDAGVNANQVKGLPIEYNDDNPETDFTRFRVKGLFANNQWEISLQDYKGRTGSLLLPRPATLLRFAVDLEPDSKGPDPTLYKEWRFQGVANGTGFLQKSMAPNTKFFLVFRGKGNACDNASDFNYWRLEINGSKASYAFWGKMAQN